MKVNKIYTTTDHRNFPDETSAMLRQAIIDCTKEIKSLKRQLDFLKSKCQCDHLINTSSVTLRYIRGENQFGDECGIKEYYQSCRCLVCEQDFEKIYKGSQVVSLKSLGRW